MAPTPHHHHHHHLAVRFLAAHVRGETWSRARRRAAAAARGQGREARPRACSCHTARGTAAADCGVPRCQQRVGCTDANSSPRSRVTQMGFTALHDAAAEGHVQVVRVLLAAGAQSDVPDNVSPFARRRPVAWRHCRGHSARARHIALSLAGGPHRPRLCALLSSDRSRCCAATAGTEQVNEFGVRRGHCARPTKRGANSWWSWRERVVCHRAGAIDCQVGAATAFNESPHTSAPRTARSPLTTTIQWRLGPSHSSASAQWARLWPRTSRARGSRCACTTATPPRRRRSRRCPA